MLPLTEIILAISPNSLINSVQESVQDYTLAHIVQSFEIDIKRLMDGLANVSVRDSFTLTFSAATGETTFSLSSKDQAKVDVFVNNLQTWNAAFSKINGTLKLRISKAPKKKTLSIYSLSTFTEYFIQGSPTEVLEKVSHLADTAYYLECVDIKEVTKSTLFVFGPKPESDSYPVNPESAHKVKHLELRSKSCTVYSNVKSTYIPTDFVFDKRLPVPRLEELFSRLALAFCLLSIADISKIDAAGSFSFTVKGYTTEKLEVTSMAALESKCFKQYFDVYQWAYTDGNIIDKLGICRNLLTIHAENNDLLKIKDGWLDSVVSNHAIYLKDNLKQYVDVKNKLSDQIQRGSEKASDVAKSITTYLRTSIFSLSSFLLSAFLVRTLAKPTPTETAIITPSVYWLFILIIVMSVLVLGYALAETNAEMIRYKKTYRSFKSRYTDLLSKEDINFIFDSDRDFSRDIKYIRNTRRKAVMLWICSLAVMLCIVTFMKYNGY